MGLDIVEFVMSVAEAVGVRIPNAVAERLVTPRHLIDYLHSHLPQSRESRCLSQRAFYRVRQELADRIGRPPAVLRPGTELPAALPSSNAQTVWADVGESLGVPRWPPARGGGWLARVFLSSRPRTLGEAARHVAAVAPTVFKPGGEGWSWGEVAGVVDWHIRYHFVIREYSLDNSSIEDLGLS